MKFIQWILCVLLLSSALISANETAKIEPVRVELVFEENSIQSGRPFTVALHYKLDNQWHAYWKNPGDTGMGIQVDWTLPEGFNVTSLNWPYPTQYNTDGIITYGYTNEFLLLAEITPPPQITVTEVPIQARLKWVACSNDMCLPGKAEVSMNLPVSNETPVKTNPHIETARSKLPKAIEVVARKNGELLELHLPDSIAQPVHAYFCPEENEAILKQIEPVIAKSDNHHVVILKADQLNETLKGVLVLERHDGSSEALEVASVIIPDANEKDSISMAPSISDETANSDDVSTSFWMAIAFAFVGGLLLNLMPCVLPVISLKILSFVKMAGEDRLSTLKHGLYYSLGVLLSFWVLAGVLIALQAYGNAVGWGFQLQNPMFLGGLIAVIFIFSMSLFGVFEMGTSLTSLAGKAEGNGSALMSGVLATAIATPCTGPFMGTALGIAAGLSAPLALLVFTALGVGMASPYLLLSAFPQLMRFLPKPGNWMITFKEITGFFMLATVLWLVWVFAAQSSSFGIVLLLSSLFFISIACWVFGKWATPIQKRATRYTGYFISIALFILGGSILYVATASSQVNSEVAEASGWEKFSPERVAELQAQGIPVFVDFTARWCLTCQANHLVLSMDKVEQMFNEKGVVKMKADWTTYDDVITEALGQFGRNGVPLYVYFPPEGGSALLPQILTPDIVLRTLTETNNETALK